MDELLKMTGAALTMFADATGAFADDAYIMSRTETDGKTYTIDTGYLMNPNTCIVADFEFTAREVEGAPATFTLEHASHGTAIVII